MRLFDFSRTIIEFLTLLMILLESRGTFYKINMKNKKFTLLALRIGSTFSKI